MRNGAVLRVFVVLTSAIVLFGCSRTHEPELTSGESVDIVRVFGFVFPKDKDRYVQVPFKALVPGIDGGPVVEQVNQLLLHGASFKAPRGITLDRQSIEPYSWPVSWGNVSVSGLSLTVRCHVAVQANAPAGQADVELYMPGLAELGVVLRTSPVLESVSDSESESESEHDLFDVLTISPSKALSLPNTYVVRRIHVHSSVAGKYASAGIKWGLVVIGFFLATIIGHSMRKRGSRT